MSIEEILSKANIEKEFWDSCFVDESGGIWQPQMNEFGKVTRNGEMLYQEFLNQTPQVPQQDLQKAKLEIATLNLLTDLGVI